MILLLLLVGGTCFLEDDTFTGQDLETKTSMNHLKSYLWVRLRLEAHRLKAFKHFRPVSPTTICSCFFFSQSITGASIIYNPIFCFLLDPPPTPEKALKTTDSPIFPGELSQFDMDALKSVPRKQGHSLYPRWISLNRKIWLSNLLASMVTLYFFTVWCVQSWDEKIFFGEKLQF